VDNSLLKFLISHQTLYKLVIWILLVGSVIILIQLAPILTNPEHLWSDDFFHFWAGGYQNLNGENPFDPYAIEQLKIQSGAQPNETFAPPVILNPPWVIAILMPFGITSFPISRLAWLIFSTLFLVISSQILWRLYSGNRKQQWLAILVVFLFAPTISVLEKGQLTPLLLLGIVGFLYYIVVDRNDWLAGISLAIVTIKPQVVILFWIALLFWVIKHHRWVIPISTSITILSLTLISMIFNPNIISQYFEMLHTYSIADWANPTIGSYIRFFWLGIDKFWPQFLPSALGLIGFIYYWHKHHKYWNWLDKMPIILLASQLISPYSWTYDLVILVPAMILAVIWIASDWKRWITLLFVIIFMSVNILDLILHMRLDDFWFIWMTPALFIWFIMVRWQYPILRRRQNPSLSDI
jgi:hypothetical protein